MRLSILPALLLVAAAVGSAPAAEGTMPSTCTTSCAACLRATPQQADTQSATAPKPWYIGPKGGDIRKGHSPSPGELWVAVHGNAPVSAAESVAATPKPWYIGPKGGDIRKGHAPSPSETYAAIHETHAAVTAKACDRYQAPAVGPKGGLIKNKGQSDADILAHADAACLVACSR
ncbi:MAG: hypothetical protein HY859_15855 [Caulobacterales bacterium]|nr:hypothetical protein [Caulobacterales bacterium]